MNQLQDDWHNARGVEYINDCGHWVGDYDDWNCGGGLGSIMMMLERGEIGSNNDDKATRFIIYTKDTN